MDIAFEFDEIDKIELVINNLVRFEDFQNCQQYIQQISTTNRFVLTLNSQLGLQLIPSIRQQKQIISIYIYSADTQAKEEYLDKYSKVKLFQQNKFTHSIV